MFSLPSANKLLEPLFPGLMGKLCAVVTQTQLLLDA